MIVLYDSAIRVSELTGLHVNDVNTESLSLHVVGKGNKERTIAIIERAAEHIRNYISVYHPIEIHNPDGWLFYTIIKGRTGRISTSTIERLVQKYADEVRHEHPDIPEHVYPHLLRAERATHLYRDGVESALISKMLGHSSIETTKVYALPSLDQMREAMEKAQPTAAVKEKPLWEEEGEDGLARLCGLR